MVNRSTSLDAVFHALSDPTRRAMVVHLSRGPATIGELGHPFDLTKPAVTKHVKVLERAGLLKRAVDGRVHRCAIDPRVLDQAQAWVAKVRAYWDERFDDLDDYLQSVQKEKKHR